MRYILEKNLQKNTLLVGTGLESRLTPFAVIQENTFVGRNLLQNMLKNALFFGKAEKFAAAWGIRPSNPRWPLAARPPRCYSHQLFTIKIGDPTQFALLAMI